MPAIGLADRGVAPGCCAAVYLSWFTGPRGRVCRPHAAWAATEIGHAPDWDRTRPFGRWSYARPGANPAQGNPNSMPQIAVSAKSSRPR